MEKDAHPKILLYQSVGFLAIITLSWLDELTGLSSLLLGDFHAIPEFHVSILEMLFVLVVWLLVANSTRRVLERVRYLEGFMKVCAWCRRIEYKDEWISLEKFMEQGFDTPTTHGICTKCLDLQKTAAAQARQKRSDSTAKKEKHSAA